MGSEAKRLYWRRFQINLQMYLHPPTRVQHKQLFLWINWTPTPHKAFMDILRAPPAGCEQN